MSKEMVTKYQNMGTKRLEGYAVHGDFHHGGLAHLDLVFPSKLLAFLTKHGIECVMVSLEQNTSFEVGARMREGGTFPPVPGASAIVDRNICGCAGALGEIRCVRVP